jgi:surfeit locus 1 family protein
MLKIKSERLSLETISLPQSGLSLLGALFSRRRWWTTLVVLLGMAVLARLGVWQLDRLEQRRARNTAIIHQLELSPLALTGESLPGDQSSLKNRRGSAYGEFDFSHQVALLHQNWRDTPGIHLITPLVIDGTSQAVLVDRGWLPTNQAALENWSQFDEPGPVSVTGIIQLSQTLPARAGDVAQRISAEPQAEWYRVDIEAIQAQVPYELLPIYILESPPDESIAYLPYRVKPKFDLSDGPHLGYAIQWFIFSVILGVIYVRIVTKKETDEIRTEDDSHES